MKTFHYCKIVAITLACWGLALPLPLAQAAQPSAQSRIASTAKIANVLDVSLDFQGTLQGQVIDEKGSPQSNTPVEVHSETGVVARSMTDKAGRFSIAGLRGGSYRVATPRGAQLCRAWSNKTAPPAAVNRLVVVHQQGIQRGQQPIGALFTSDTFLIGSVVAAAIIIPIAIHNSQSDDPSGS